MNENELAEKVYTWWVGHCDVECNGRNLFNEEPEMVVLAKKILIENLGRAIKLVTARRKQRGYLTDIEKSHVANMELKILRIGRDDKL